MTISDLSDPSIVNYLFLRGKLFLCIWSSVSDNLFYSSFTLAAEIDEGIHRAVIVRVVTHCWYHIINICSEFRIKVHELLFHNMFGNIIDLSTYFASALFFLYSTLWFVAFFSAWSETGSLLWVTSWCRAGHRRWWGSKYQ